MSQFVFLNPAQAAEILGVSEATARQWARKGIVPARKIGKPWRFLESELREAGNKNFYGSGVALMRRQAERWSQREEPNTSPCLTRLRRPPQVLVAGARASQGVYSSLVCFSRHNLSRSFLISKRARCFCSARRRFSSRRIATFLGLFRVQ
jgi:excisionase family DNA binding protein